MGEGAAEVPGDGTALEADELLTNELPRSLLVTPTQQHHRHNNDSLARVGNNGPLDVEGEVRASDNVSGVPFLAHPPRLPGQTVLDTAHLPAGLPEGTVTAAASRPPSPSFLPLPESPTLQILSDDMLHVLQELEILEEAETVRSTSDATIEPAAVLTIEPENEKWEDPLSPDPGTEIDFEVRENPFAFSPGQLGKLFNPKSLTALHALGGLGGLEKGLRTNIITGLDYDEDFSGTNITFDEAVNKAGVLLERGSTRPSAQSSINRTFSRLPTTFTSGEHTHSFRERRRVFGDGSLPPFKTRSLLYYIRKEALDSVLIVLTVAAFITIALGLYQSLRQGDLKENFSWPEGVAICTAVAIVAFLNAINDWRKEHHFTKLNQQNEHRDRLVKVIRTGKVRMVAISNVFVGDVAVFDAGDTIFADGVLIRGHDVRCDESMATGESDLIKKSSARAPLADQEYTQSFDPFIISGSVIESGRGSFLVTAVGSRSSNGQIRMCLQTYNDGLTDTALQKALNQFANQIAKGGIITSALLFLVLFIRFIVQIKHSHSTGISEGLDFLSIFIIAATLVDVAVPSGLPLAMTVSLAFATRQLLKKGILVRDLNACQELQFTTTICTEKTGLLTENTMSIASGVIGIDGCFEDVLLKEKLRDPLANTKEEPRSTTEDKMDKPNSLDYLADVHREVQELVRLSIITTLTAFEGEYEGHVRFCGPQMESALFDFAKRHFTYRETVSPPPANARQTALGKANITGEEARGTSIETLLTWSHAPQVCYLKSEGCRFTICITALKEGKYRMFVSGLARPLLKKCQYTISDRKSDANVIVLDRDAKESVERTIDRFESNQLRVMGFSFKDLANIPPHRVDESGVIQLDNNTRLNDDHLLEALTFLCAFGIKDPLRTNATEAVKLAQRAGIMVRLITSDDIVPARAVALDTGILVPGGVVMEGPTLQQLSLRQLDVVIPKLLVLARASSEDKRKLVRRLRELGEFVAVTAHGNNIHDISALKTADVSFSLESISTDVSKFASHIVLLEDSFKGIVDAILWSRAVGDGVRKFLQFQLTIGISAVILTFVSSSISHSRQSVINSVQLLWVNLIMDLFSVLALATDPPLTSEHDRKPSPRQSGNRLITLYMWKMIIGQTIFQLSVTLVLYATDLGIFNYNPERTDRDTLIFNTFVWMQIFNQINCRRLDGMFNIFEGLQHNRFFVFVTTGIVGIQLLLIFFGGTAINTVDLTAAEWGCSVLMGALTLPVGMAIRLVPNELLVGLFRRLPSPVQRRLKRNKLQGEVVVADEYMWNMGLLDIRDELAFIKKIKGGRLRGLRSPFRYPDLFSSRRNRSRSRSRSGSRQGPRAVSVDDGTRRRSDSNHDSRRDSNHRGSSGHNSRAASADGEGWRRRDSSVHSRAGSFVSAITAPGVVAGSVVMSPANEMAGIVAAGIETWDPVNRRPAHRAASRLLSIGQAGTDDWIIGS